MHYLSGCARVERQSGSVSANVKDHIMLNGIWKIETETPAEGVRVSANFLPDGARLELHIDGPTRASIEESRRNELGGRVVFLPVLPATIGVSELNKEMCDAARLLQLSYGVPIDAVFTFSKWSREDVEQPSNGFFVEQGAKVASQFLLVTIPTMGVDWNLWMSGRHQMTSRHIVTAAPRRSRAVGQTWRLVSELC